MENNKYLNQKSEYNSHQLFFPLNKNLQFQNIFKDNFNLNKQKDNKYYINKKKEINLISRNKVNEIGINGPKILTINFPPEFFKTDNNSKNISRKPESYEKNTYNQENMVNNMEMNIITNENEKIFVNNIKKNFLNYNNNKIYKGRNQDIENIDNNNNKKSILNKFNNNYNMNNFQNYNNYYSCSNPSFFDQNLNNNKGHLRNELGLNSENGTFFTEKEKTYKEALSHIKTEGSYYKDFSKANRIPTNFKSNSIVNSNQYNNKYIIKNMGKKINSNLIYNLKLENDNYIYKNKNSYNSNQNNPKNKFAKNMVRYNNSLNNNKLVDNPSNFTNQIIKNKNLDSELVPSSIYELYMDNNKSNYNSNEINYLSEQLSSIKLNKEYYKKIKNYNQYPYRSENHSMFSFNQDKNSKSPSREKNYNKVQNNNERKNSSNYNKNLILELKKNSKRKIYTVPEYNKNILKEFEMKNIKIENLNLGISYKIYNGYKYYLDVKYGQIYILKDINFNFEKEIISSIEEWNKNFRNDGLYLKIYGNKSNFNKEQTTLIIQYPIGGESLNDIINSVGFYDQNFLFNIITKIYKGIIKVKENISNEKYKNISFCLCDIYLNINEHIKIIPPIIRQISMNSNLDKKINFQNSLCNCKENIILFQNKFNINKDSIPFFCLGFLIIQIITQNLIFELNSFKHILININNIKNKCCLAHLLLDIEEEKLNGNKYLLFSHFLILYPKSLLSFLHECTSFDNIIPSPSNEFLNLYDTNKNLNLSIKEILEITILPKNEYMELETFLKYFEDLYKNIKEKKDDYIRLLKKNKVIHTLSRCFNIDKEIFLNQIIKKIDIN